MREVVGAVVGVFGLASLGGVVVGPLGAFVGAIVGAGVGAIGSEALGEQWDRSHHGAYQPLYRLDAKAESSRTLGRAPHPRPAKHVVGPR